MTITYFYRFPGVCVRAFSSNSKNTNELEQSSKKVVKSVRSPAKILYLENALTHEKQIRINLEYLYEQLVKDKHKYVDLLKLEKQKNVDFLELEKQKTQELENFLKDTTVVNRRTALQGLALLLFLVILSSLILAICIYSVDAAISEKILVMDEIASQINLELDSEMRQQLAKDCISNPKCRNLFNSVMLELLEKNLNKK